MTMTIDRPLAEHETWQLTAALEAFSLFIAGVDWAELPPLWGSNVHPQSTMGETVSAQIIARPRETAAQAALAWRQAVPDARVQIEHRGHGGGAFWDCRVIVPGPYPIALWVHLDVTDEQGARLERDPQTAYAVLVDIARTP